MAAFGTKNVHNSALWDVFYAKWAGDRLAIIVEHDPESNSVFFNREQSSARVMGFDLLMLYVCMYVVRLLCYKNKTCKSGSRRLSRVFFNTLFAVTGLAILDSLLFFNHKEVNITRSRKFVMLSTQPIVITNVSEHVFFTAHHHSWYPGRIVALFFTSGQLFVYFRWCRAFGFGMTCGLTP